MQLELIRDRDWQRERAEACVAANASAKELPEAWHAAEQAFQCFVRAVGVLQVHFLQAADPPPEQEILHALFRRPLKP